MAETSSAGVKMFFRAKGSKSNAASSSSRGSNNGGHHHHHQPKGLLSFVQFCNRIKKIVSLNEEVRRALYGSERLSTLDLDSYLPDLIGPTEVLTDEYRKQLAKHLPARVEGYPWSLVFSTSQNGFSLNSLYRKMVGIDSPILLIIEDTQGNVFGAVTSCEIRVSESFYGTGESFLFAMNPKLQVYQWTGGNSYFIQGNNDSLVIGAGDGRFGLWLDGDLNQGRTQPCKTFGNEPLTPDEDFWVKTLECWAFM